MKLEVHREVPSQNHFRASHIWSPAVFSYTHTHPQLTNQVPGHLHGVLRKLKVAPGLSARLGSLKEEEWGVINKTEHLDLKQ